MALKTKIIVQQILNIDDTTTTASKYPKYTVVLGNSISSITAGELTAAVEASAASAAAAEDSEIAAKDSENKAKYSEIQAGIHAGASEISATQSAASATEAERQAGLSQKSAEASALSAEESKGFRDSAELAAQNAETSRRLAEQAKSAAQTAQIAAETARTGAETAETSAEASASTAGEHAAAAKQSELNAKTSETNAATSEVEAETQAETATTEANRAKAEADRASQIVDSKLDKEDISGFIKVYKTKEEADTDVSSRVLGEKILVWNQTDSKYGWYKVAGTAETPELELVETEQKIVSINNVRADDVGNIQITLPGGNPSLWLGEVTWFPYDKDSGVGYPGVLPADGREVLRVDYPDTWEAIEAGLIPSVTEEQWQAGATLYFSTGNGTTTFRLPDMMQGQAFRAAAKGEENAGAIKEQIPYITMVNGIGPSADGSVNIAISADSFEGILPVAKGGTGASTIETARSALGLGEASVEDIIPINKGGTGASTIETARSVLGLGEASTEDIIPINKGGTGASTVEEARTALEVPASSDVLKKANNLSDLADRAAAWLNVRPIGATPLAADPVSEMDAATRGWVLEKVTNPNIQDTLQVVHKETVLPAGTTAGGWLTSRLSENGVNIADASMSVAATKGSSVAVTRLSAVSRIGGVFKQAILAIDSDGNMSCESEARGRVFSGRDGAFGPAVIKKADRSSTDADNVNYLSQVENNTTKIYHYLVSPGGSQQQFVTRMDVTGLDIKYFSIRADNGMYTPEGRVAIQGSDIRIKNSFTPAMDGAAERIAKIGVMEFYYNGSKIRQRGFLAQQMADIDDTYTYFGGTALGDDGNEFEIMNVNDRAVMADVVTVVQELQRKNTEIETLKSEVAELKELVNLMLQK
ncbi:tail fibers protein [Citrobacter phage YZU-L1]|nr:tail fibers protein [Citrobacter phage YZU-L1]